MPAIRPTSATASEAATICPPRSTVAASREAAITLRFGSIANRRDGPTAFDGGYMALHVSHVSKSGGFAGRWASGVHARRVDSFLCAVPH